MIYSFLKGKAPQNVKNITTPAAHISTPALYPVFQNISGAQKFIFPV
jgi:hypothetical protein